MDNNNSIATLILLSAFFLFSFIFSYLALTENNLFYMVLALLGYGLSLFNGLAFSLALQKEGGRIALWFFIQTGLISIVTVWFITKLGVKYGFL